MNIQVRIREVYGNVHAYPVNHEAECIARIANQKTLTPTTLLHVLALGGTISVMDQFGQVSKSFFGAESETTGEIRELMAIGR